MFAKKQSQEHPCQCLALINKNNGNNIISITLTNYANGLAKNGAIKLRMYFNIIVKSI